MTTNRMRLVMDRIRCFAWLAERSQKVSRIAVIRDDMYYGVVASASLIAYDVTKLRPWRGRPFGYGKVSAICAIMAPPSVG